MTFGTTNRLLEQVPLLVQSSLNSKELKTYSLYNQYCRYQKARVATKNMMLSHLRHYGDADLSAYQVAIIALQQREKTVLKELCEIFEVKAYDRRGMPDIKGLGVRIWIGLMITANPMNFKAMSSYLRFCGLTGDVIQNHKYNRHAKSLYHMLSEQILKRGDGKFRPLYDKLKADMAIKYAGQSRVRINNAALNRTSTFLAKEIYHFCKENGSTLTN